VLLDAPETRVQHQVRVASLTVLVVIPVIAAEGVAVIDFVNTDFIRK